MFHRDALAQFPQHAALALTNCLYLSHRCATFPHAYRHRLPKVIADDISSVSFADMVLKLRTTGIEVFQVRVLLFSL